MILIIRDKETKAYRFSKYEFTSLKFCVEDAIREFLRSHGYKRQEYEFTYKGLNFKGMRLSDRMDTEVTEV